MKNDEKDRHVLAAAVHAGAPLIVTFNLRYFRSEHVGPWRVVALHPQAFLIELFRQERELVIMNATVPDFVAVVSRSESSQGS